jgi:hypothetical protein
MSCPYTSPQNGKAERMIRTTNDVMRTLLFQASLPARFWAESLPTATYLLNCLPSTTSPTPAPQHALFGTPPRYDHLRVFGCACYPNTSATASHKLVPRSTRCVFLGYSLDHKGYRYLDLTSRQILISRHVVFDELDFPFSTDSTPASDLELLESLFPTDPVVQPPFSNRSAGPPPVFSPDALAPLPMIPAVPRAAPEAPSPPTAPRAAPVGPSSPAAPRVAPETPLPPTAPRAAPVGHSSPAVPRAAPEAPSPPAAPRAAPEPLARYAQPVRVYERQTAPPSTPPPPAGPPMLEPAHRPRIASRIEPEVYHLPVLHRDPRHQHHMMTRRAAGVLRPTALSAAAAEPGISPVPSFVRAALTDPHWRCAMEEEYAAFLANQTWDLVPRPPGGNVVTSKWIWTHKRRADGTLDRY